LCSPSNNNEPPNLKDQPPNPKKGETKMPTAYILVNTEIGSEKQVLKALKKIEGVEKVNNLWGVYDIIVNIKANNMDEFENIITNRIKKIGKINSKVTLLINEKTENTIQDQNIFRSALTQ
jgi:DNA-binding Lrp family transcriptional regulator